MATALVEKPMLLALLAVVLDAVCALRVRDGISRRTVPGGVRTLLPADDSENCLPKESNCGGCMCCSAPAVSGKTVIASLTNCRIVGVDTTLADRIANHVATELPNEILPGGYNVCDDASDINQMPKVPLIPNTNAMRNTPRNAHHGVIKPRTRAAKKSQSAAAEQVGISTKIRPSASHNDPDCQWRTNRTTDTREIAPQAMVQNNVCPFVTFAKCETCDSAPKRYM